MLEYYLHKLCKWPDTNNMKFIAIKFELLLYGKELEIKSVTTYKSHDDSNVNDKEQVSDLAIMTNTATFTLIRNIVNTLRGCTVDKASVPIGVGHSLPDVNVYTISKFLPSSFVLDNFF